MKTGNRSALSHALSSVVVLSTLLTAPAGAASQTPGNQSEPLFPCAGWVGLQVKAESRTPSGTVTRIEVCGVFVGGPAEGAGVRAGDVIVRIDDELVRFDSDSEMLTAFSSRCPGDEMVLTVDRGEDKTLPLAVTVEEIPSGLRAEWRRQRELAEQRARETRPGND